MCTTDVPAAYGSVIAGASGFAQLVGVACSGTCFAEASRWSAVAISHGNAPVEDAAACRALCASTQLCEVWTHDDGECRLMRAMDASTITALGGAAEVAPPVEELACTLDALGAIGVLGAAVENATTMECCAAIEQSTTSLVDAGALYAPPPPPLPLPPPPPPAPPLPPTPPLALQEGGTCPEGWVDGVVACTAARRLSEDPYGCSSSACSSPDGQGGSDCYAGPFDEACSCSSGAAYPVGTMEWEGQTYTQYTCCTAESGLPTQGSACDYPGA